MTNTPIAQQVLQEELEAVRNNIYTDRYDMGIGELLSLYKDCELVIHSDENGYVDLNSEQKTRIIENLLIGLPAPAITVVTDGLGRWELIEGEQWLKAVFQFVEEALDLSPYTSDPAEDDANRFAHELLMPEEAIRIWCRGGTSIDVIRAVLDVPKHVLRERVRALNLPLTENEKQ